ncbi:type IV secretion system DNA-binding domain-containing protein [Candidatus Uhrbacteria bacterium]|nr:type IV secretion system DNA-binding domain-containing protein [Candidatus Uhrbacteria bacterium]
MIEQFFTIIQENPAVNLAVWFVISFAGLSVLLYGTRFVLHRVFEIPMALNKIVLQILVPKEPAKKEEEDKSSKKDYKELIGVVESFYASLGHVKPHWKILAFFIGREDQFALEIVSHKGLIRFYAVVPKYAREFFEQQFHAQYPSAHIAEVEDYNLFRPKGFIDCAPIILNKSSIFPIRTYKKMDSDPLNSITNMLSKVAENDGAAIQIMVRTAPKGWGHKANQVARAMQRGKTLKEAMGGHGADVVLKGTHQILSRTMDAALTSSKGAMTPQGKKEDAFPRLTPVEQELIKGIEEKAGKVAFEVNIRVVACSDHEKVAKAYVYDIANSFAQYLGLESGAQLVKLKKYQFLKWPFIRSFIYRRFKVRRSFILSTEELASIFHPPLSITETPNIEWLKSRAAPPPHNLPKEGIILGESAYRGRHQLIRMLPEDRRRHVYVIGMTGVGKSTVMMNMMVQDIKNGNGCCYIDPHGQDLETILENIPPERADDVILFEPSDVERPIGLNMLEAETEDEKDFVAQEMISIFYKLVTDPSMIGPMFEHYMRNAMLTLMSDPKNPNTIVEIPRILTDKDFQKLQLKNITDPIIRAFWEKELPQTSGQTKGEMLPYLVSKIGRFIENNMMRNIIGQPKSGFDFREVMDKKKILLVNLSKGKIGEMNSNLLGLIIVTKLQMAALARANMPEKDRSDFFLYIDEFQNFITDSIATILSEARKYRLDLILGHQFIAQLVPKQGDTKVRDAVFGNVGTIVSFRVGVDDSELIAKQMAPVFNEFDVMNIEQYTAYIRLMIKNTAARPFNMKTFAPPKGDPTVAGAIRQLSRLKYGRDRALVEAETLERSQLAGDTIEHASTW